MLLIGIDPGVNTGFAVYDKHDKKLLKLCTVFAVEAEEMVLDYKLRDEPIIVYMEDARLRQWFGEKKNGLWVKSGTEKLQGAGSVKRDCSRWEEFCDYHKIPIIMTPPQKNLTKTTAAYFQKITGWDKRSSEHSRDAAMLVYGK